MGNMALQDPEGTIQKRHVEKWLEAIAERSYLDWFFQKADFGPADGDVRQMMQDQYEKETGRTVPLNYKQETDE
jgi:hypothetical protein